MVQAIWGLLTQTTGVGPTAQFTLTEDTDAHRPA